MRFYGGTKNRVPSIIKITVPFSTPIANPSSALIRRIATIGGSDTLNLDFQYVSKPIISSPLIGVNQRQIIFTPLTLGFKAYKKIVYY